VREQVRGAFVRVLTRDPGVRVIPGKEDDHEVHFRDRLYRLNVVVTAAAVCVYLTRDDPFDYPVVDGSTYRNMFFNYNCPISKMGRLRQTALILLKKMQHAEVYEVMSA
jgi:hypothetical protein